jgi:endo-1,4-beta-xylanase
MQSRYNLDYGGAKTTAYINLVNRLKARGVKITQIGSQSHLTVGGVPSASSLTSTFTSITATGVDLAVTELDIRMTLPVTSALLAQQKKDYNTVILACIRTPKCVGVTIWTYSDYYSWVPATFPGEVRSILIRILLITPSSDTGSFSPYFIVSDKGS